MAIIKKSKREKINVQCEEFISITGCGPLMNVNIKKAPVKGLFFYTLT